MSSMLMVVLRRYQRAQERRRVRSASVLPCLAYQQTRMVRLSIMNGTVRRTACSLRLQASPAPMISFASLMVCSMDHRWQ